MKTPWQNSVLKLQETHTSLQLMATAIEKICFRWYQCGPSEQRTAVIVGNPGCGKTHSLRRAYQWSRGAAYGAYQNGRRSLPSSSYEYWPECVARLERGESTFLYDLKAQSLLFLDDIGSEGEADHWKRHAVSLCGLLEARGKLWNVITTNLQPTQWVEFYGERIADRLIRNSIVVDISEVPSFATVKMRHGI